MFCLRSCGKCVTALDLNFRALLLNHYCEIRDCNLPLYCLTLPGLKELLTLLVNSCREEKHCTAVETTARKPKMKVPKRAGGLGRGRPAFALGSVT